MDITEASERIYLKGRRVWGLFGSKPERFGGYNEEKVGRMQFKVKFGLDHIKSCTYPEILGNSVVSREGRRFLELF